MTSDKEFWRRLKGELTLQISCKQRPGEQRGEERRGEERRGERGAVLLAQTSHQSPVQLITVLWCKVSYTAPTPLAHTHVSNVHSAQSQSQWRQSKRTVQCNCIYRCVWVIIIISDVQCGVQVIIVVSRVQSGVQTHAVPLYIYWQGSTANQQPSVYPNKPYSQKTAT